MELIEQTIKDLQEKLQNFAPDVNTYILLVTLREILAPVHAKLMMADDDQSQIVCRQIKLIADLSGAIIELVNVKKVEIKN